MQTPPRRVRVARNTPIPTAIEIHNLFPLLMMISEGEQQIRRRQRHEHSIHLLYKIKLQIVTTDTSGRENVLYEAVHPTKTVCPSWRGLNDVGGIVASDLTIDEYESMKAHFSVDDETFLRVPIHPSKLTTVEKKPETLPLNAVLITFSDESTRVSQALYKLLVEDTSYPTQAEAVVQSVEKSFESDYSRFEDDVFRTLDQVTPLRGGGGGGESSQQQLLPTHDDEEEVGDDNDEAAEAAVSTIQQISLDLPDLLGTEETRDQAGMALSDPTKVINHSRNDDDDDREPSSPSSRQQQRGPAGLRKTVGQQQHHRREQTDTTNSEELDNEKDSPIVIQQDLEEENLLLEQLLEEETHAFGKELADLAGTKDHFEDLVRQHKTCEEQTSQVVLATEQVQLESQKTAFLLQSQRILLIRDLRIVYPISVDNDLRYRIRGLEIPDNVNAGTVPEEELAAAIGCLGHVVTMMSKYLSIQLRYRVYCHASRSAIRDDRGVMFPLFLAGRSTIDRERFEIGVTMLHHDVMCICKERDIQGVSPKLHMLAKVKRIYEHLIEGY